MLFSMQTLWDILFLKPSISQFHVYRDYPRFDNFADNKIVSEPLVFFETAQRTYPDWSRKISSFKSDPNNGSYFWN